MRSAACFFKILSCRALLSFWGILSLVSAFQSLSGHAHAEELVAALSTDQIEIASNFDGSQIVIFGSIERGSTAATRSSYDIVITARGPAETIVARRKEQVLGLWINQGSRQFSELPSYYAVMTSKPLDDITTDQIAERYRLGLSNLPTEGARSGRSAADNQRFVDALFRLKIAENLYHYDAEGVTFLSPRLFRTTLDLPANIPVGDYQVSINLFAGSAPLATSEHSFRVSKIGFERATYDFAKNQSVLYGIATVLIAVFTGWLAGLIFRRD